MVISGMPNKENEVTMFNLRKLKKEELKRKAAFAKARAKRKKKSRKN